MANKWPDFEAVIILDANGNQVTSFGGGSGGTSHTDDAAFTAATDSFTPVGGIVTADSVDSGDGGAFAMLANRQQKVTLYDSAAAEKTSWAVTNAGTFVVQENGAALTALQLIDNIVKLEDDAHSTGDAGVMFLGVRQDVQADFGADGDYVPLSVNADGQLRVEASVAASTAESEYADDEAFTLTTDKVSMAGAIRDDSLSALAAAEGDAVPLRVSQTGALWVNATGTVAISDGSDTVSVFAPADDQPNGTLALLTLARGQLFDGSTWDRAPGDATNGALVNLGANNDVTVAGVATAANQTTIIGHVDGIEGLLTTIDADTGGILTAVELIDNSVVVLGTATYTEATSSGLAIGAVRRDADTTLVNTTNEWGPLQMDANGRLKVEAFSGETLPVSGTVTANLAAGTNNIGDVDILTIAAGSNLVGDVGIQPRTTNGFTTFMASGSDGSSILVATAQAIKASAGKLYGYYIFNPEAATTFVHFYNTAAASVTVGTTNPLFTLAIPAGSAANLMSDIGITFSNAGWSCAATTTAGGNTAPATGVSLVAWYA